MMKFSIGFATNTTAERHPGWCRVAAGAAWAALGYSGNRPFNRAAIRPGPVSIWRKEPIFVRFKSACEINFNRRT